ncbi:hypothetical protein ERJ75_001034400 [Trypanosoma vivax]|uniref:Uncharacterized protein n=1 Tax=Trypanosoma vivax (strain Y486) TaxID=1055687 RepID=F9WMI4_TRYVY|nr:hypothetical protein ERJ75_001034400 [Trypanosoma vivax]CCD18741.1 hypothetical protein, conserved in T. vivax [Trypanosoma vivax Y486]|eukprot:CCD18741.1 hypothetical protein, conserved in T. vivax [Trypanosoma vivax Y486]
MGKPVWLFVVVLCLLACSTNVLSLADTVGQDSGIAMAACQMGRGYLHVKSVFGAFDAVLDKMKAASLELQERAKKLQASEASGSTAQVEAGRAYDKIADAHWRVLNARRDIKRFDSKITEGEFDNYFYWGDELGFRDAFFRCRTEVREHVQVIGYMVYIEDAAADTYGWKERVRKNWEDKKMDVVGFLSIEHDRSYGLERVSRDFRHFMEEMLVNFGTVFYYYRLTRTQLTVAESAVAAIAGRVLTKKAAECEEVTAAHVAHNEPDSRYVRCVEFQSRVRELQARKMQQNQTSRATYPRDEAGSDASQAQTQTQSLPVSSPSSTLPTSPSTLSEPPPPPAISQQSRDALIHVDGSDLELIELALEESPNTVVRSGGVDTSTLVIAFTIPLAILLGSVLVYMALRVHRLAKQPAALP